jgi:RNA polymerase sigma-70 factor (ECF subfamily)
LYDESSNLVFSIASRILTDRADAEEITIDVYSYVWQSAAQFRSSRASVAAWLIMLTRSRAIDRVRSNRVREGAQSPNGTGRRVASAPATVSSDFSGRILVNSALEQLEFADRELLELVFYAGLSYTELAARQQAPVGTVKTRVRAALYKVRKMMGEG